MKYEWDGDGLRIRPADDHEASVLMSLLAVLDAYGVQPASGSRRPPAADVERELRNIGRAVREQWQRPGSSRSAA